MKDEFIQAIHEKNKMQLTYFSKKDGANVTRLCAPMDVGPHRSYSEKGDYYHVWDFDGASKPHSVPLKEENIIEMIVLTEKFDPGDFVSWTPNWIVPRDWGVYS